MHPIFEIRDILDEIFFWLSSRDLAATICVNKAWFRASLYLLWRTINISEALKLLGPTVQLKDSDGCYVSAFSQNFTPDNWKRFMTYAQPVRVLHADDKDSLALNTAILCSLRKEFPYLFPNCRYLSWHTRRIAGIPEDLLPASLDHVVLTGRAVDHEWQDLFQLLVTKPPSLSVFHIDCESFPVPSQSPGSDLFLDLLTKLLTEEHADHLHGPKCFSSLKTLTLGPLTSCFLVSDIFDCFSFPSVTEFNWDIHNINFDFDTFVKVISMVAPNLETLSLGARGFMNNSNVSWSSLRFLLNRVKLTSLSIHCVQVDMTLNNLVELLRSRQEPSSWHVLEITTTRPFHFQDALLSVAKYSPKIHTLGLRVHDQNFVRLYTDIPELSSRLIPRHAKKKNIRTQVELRGQLNQAGFFLPCISVIRFNQSICSLDSIGPVAFLILALCDLDKLQDFIADDEDLGFRIGCRMTKYHNATRNLRHTPGTRRRFFRHQFHDYC